MDTIDPTLKRSMMNNIRFQIFDYNYNSFDDSYWNFPAVNDSMNRLYVMMDGAGEVVYGKEILQLQPGRIYLIPGGMTIDLKTNKYIEKFWANFKLELFPGMDYCRSLPFGIGREYDSMLLNKIAECYDKNDPFQMLKLHCLLLEEILKLMQPYQKNYQEEMDVLLHYQSLFLWLENNCRADLTVEDLARVAGVSAATLQKGFRKGCGISPKEYLKRRIMEKGKNLLGFSDFNIGQIAEELGFSDAAYFSRYFKKDSGYSPLEYRKIFSPSRMNAMS